MNTGNKGSRWTGGAEGIKGQGIKGPREGQQWARDLDESQGAVQVERGAWGCQGREAGGARVGGAAEGQETEWLAGKTRSRQNTWQRRSRRGRGRQQSPRPVSANADLDLQAGKSNVWWRQTCRSAAMWRVG